MKGPLQEQDPKELETDAQKLLSHNFASRNTRSLRRKTLSLAEVRPVLLVAATRVLIVHSPITLSRCIVDVQQADEPSTTQEIQDDTQTSETLTFRERRDTPCRLSNLLHTTQEAEPGTWVPGYAR